MFPGALVRCILEIYLVLKTLRGYLKLKVIRIRVSGSLTSLETEEMAFYLDCQTVDAWSDALLLAVLSRFSNTGTLQLFLLSSIDFKSRIRLLLKCFMLDDSVRRMLGC